MLNTPLASKSARADPLLQKGDGVALALPETVRIAFKVARRDIARGETVLKYGAPIGSATAAIPTGRVVHTHNMKSDYL